LRLEPISPGRALVFDDDRLLDWCAARVPHADLDGWRGRAAALGVAVHGTMAACMVLFDYDRRYGNAEIAMAADNPLWATRGTMARLLDWPFGQLGCRRLTTITEAGNERALRLNRALGFREEGVIRSAYGPGSDAILMGLLRDDLPTWALLRRTESPIVPEPRQSLPAPTGDTPPQSDHGLEGGSCPKKVLRLPIPTLRRLLRRSPTSRRPPIMPR
jgi:RimJ/RimL family protein N-acetyltransferase